MIHFIHVVIALPLLLFAGLWFIKAMYKPHVVGMLGMSFFFFTLQFVIGIFLFPLSYGFGIGVRAQDIVASWMLIYLFWLTVFILAVVFRSPLPYFEIPYRDEEYRVGNGIFANLAIASMQVRMIAIIFLYAGVIFVRLFLAMRYGIGLSGTFLKYAGTVPYFWLSLWVVMNPLGIVLCFTSVIKFIMQRSYVSLGLILIEMAYLFFQGRRQIVIAFTLILFAYLILHGKIKVKYLVGSVFALIFLWFILFPYFFFMRTEWVQKVNVFQAVIAAGPKVVTDRELFLDNVRGRLQALRVNYYIAHQVDNNMPKTNGLFIRSAIVGNIPRKLYSNKFAFAPPPDELLDETYGIGLESKDTFSNFGLFAMADFGILGGIVYGAIFFFCIRIIEQMMKVLFPRSSLGFLICFSMAASCPVMQMEWTLNDLLLSVRTVLMIFIIMYMVSFFFSRNTELVLAEAS